MPSHSLNQLADLEEIVSKNFLNLDPREPCGPPSDHLARTTGYVGDLYRNASFSLSSLSCYSTEPSDGLFLTTSQWVQQSECPLHPQPSVPNRWGKSAFLSQRSISLVETSSTGAASLGWPSPEIKTSQCDLSPALLGSGSSSSSSLACSSSSSRYKTELCRSFTENGLCKYGAKCQFAHGQEELRDLNRHPKYKTEPCRTFHTIGFCPYGIRCHFVHNREEEKKNQQPSSIQSFSSSSNIPQQLTSSRPHRPPLVRQSFSFAGFPSAPQPVFLPTRGTAPLTRAPSASPPSCADITDLLSHAFIEMDSAFEASPAHQPPRGTATLPDQPSPFLPSPDSGYSPCGPSPTASPSLRQSPSTAGILPGSLGARSLSYTSLSDQDGGSSASSVSGSESSGNEGSARRLAVFSQLSIPDDATGFCL